MLSQSKARFHAASIKEWVPANAVRRSPIGKRSRKPVAEQRHLIGKRQRVDRQVIGMDVHVPQAG